MKLRREAANKLRGFSYNNNSQVSSLNHSMDKTDLQDIQNPTDNFENEQVNQKTQTSARFYQELEFNIANDEEKIIEFLRKLLKIDPIKRTFRDCMSIYKLLRTSPFMVEVVNNEGFKIAVRLCKHLIYETFDERQYIYKEGMACDKVYILLNGKLGVTLRDRQQNDVLIKEINKFEDFGKIEVQNNVSRNSSILALKRSEICSIDKRTYQDVIGQIKKKSSDYFIDNFKLFSCFQGLSKAQQISLIPLINIKYFQRNQVVFKEKESAKQIFFIISGDFKAYSSAVVATNDYHGEYILNTSHLTAETENLFKMRHCVKKIQLAIYSTGEIVGCEDLLTDDETRSSELVCDSERGIIFAISRQDLESRIAEDDPFWQTLLDIAMLKMENKERKLEQLRDPQRKTGLNREVVLSQKRIRINNTSNERKVNFSQPLKPLRNPSCIQEQSKNLGKIQIHVNKCLNSSQERLQNNSVIIRDFQQSKPLINNMPYKQIQNFENPLKSSEILSSSEIYSSQQLDEVHLIKNNSFITQFDNHHFVRHLGEKQYLHSHRNSYLSNQSSSTHETNADTQETTGSKGKSDVSARQNFQIMNSTSQSDFSQILPPKKFIVSSRKNRIHSQEDLKTQESGNYSVQNTVQPMTHRARGNREVIRKDMINRSMDNLEFLKTVQNAKTEDTEKVQEGFDQVNQSQLINKYLGGNDKHDCYKEIMNNLKKKNIQIHENKEFNDVHMNYNYLRSSRIDRSSIKLHRISQKLFQDQNNLNTSINEQDNSQKMSQVNLQQVNNNTFIAKAPKIISNSFFTSFKFNQINHQNNKISFIQNPRALKSSQQKLNSAKESLNNSQNNLSIDHQTIQNNYTNNTTNSQNNYNQSSLQNEFIETNRNIQYSNETTARCKQIRIKKKNIQNLLNQSIL